jgi:5-methylcytosine-specific restriction enzyme subunit McrC
MREHDSRIVRLAPATAADLVSRFGKLVEVLPHGAGEWRLRTRSTIGTLYAGDLELRILPKCGTKNVLAMLGWAHDLATISTELEHHEKTDDLRRFLVALLVAQLEDLTRTGLRRGYVQQADDLPVLRGRLALARHLRRGPVVAPSLPCTFEDFTADLPANQAIRYTLERIGAFGAPELDLRLRRLRHAFAITSRRPFRGAELDRFTYDRLTVAYRPVHRLCNIILDGLGADDDHGSNPLGSFVVDMNILFERFVAAWLAEHLPSAWELSRQHPVRFDRGGSKRLNADIVLVRDRLLRLVADTKYRMGGGAPADNELYQVLAYARALGVHHAVLLYPDVSTPGRSLTVRDGENTIHADGIDLARPWAEVERAMHELLARLLETARRSSGP